MFVDNQGSVDRIVWLQSHVRCIVRKRQEVGCRFLCGVWLYQFQAADTILDSESGHVI